MKRKISWQDFARGKYRRKSSTSSNFSDTLGRFSSQASGASLGFITNNVPGAVAGATLATRAYDFSHQDDIDFDNYVQGETIPLPNKKMGKAMYAGKLNRPNNQPDAMQKALQIGSVNQLEQFGLVNDPHCVYIHHSTYNLPAISFAVRFGLIRKLLSKAGLKVVNRFQELTLFEQINSDGFKLEYVSYNNLTGGQNLVSYVTTNNQTISTVTQNFTGFETELNLYLGGELSKQPKTLNLYLSDRNGVDTNWRMASSVNLTDDEMHCSISSTIKVQNRTAGDTAPAGDRNAERVDSQPVIVKSYQFMNADPRTRADGGGVDGSIKVLNGTDRLEVRLLRASTDFEGTLAAQNCPPKSVFANCSKSGFSILQPGSMKQSSVYYSIKGRGLNFFKKLQYRGIASQIVNNCYGRSEYLVFEEKMRTVGTNPVSIHYERKFSVGFYALTKKGGAIIPTFAVSELNLV